MITVTKRDEAYLVVDTDMGIAQELNDFFTFDVPGARFMPLYKNRMWDGKARLFNIYKKQLYIGLLPYLKEFAETLEYPIEINIDEVGDPVSLEYVTKFTDSLNLQANEQPIDVRDYQLEAIHHTINNGRT